MNEAERDAAVVARVHDGDVEAFRDLVTRHSPRLFALVGGILRAGPDREDVVQEAWLAAYSKLESFDPGRGAFRAWICRIARNRALNVLKAHKPEPRAELPEPATSPRPEPESWDRLDRALAALPETMRQAFLLVELAGLTCEEAAAIENVPVGTLKSRGSRARERLRTALTDSREKQP